MLTTFERDRHPLMACNVLVLPLPPPPPAPRRDPNYAPSHVVTQVQLYTSKLGRLLSTTDVLQLQTSGWRFNRLKNPAENPA